MILVLLAVAAVPHLAAAQIVPPGSAQPTTQQAAADPNKPIPATAIIRGHVVGADTGQPLRKAQVRVFSTEVDAGRSRESRLANTDADGSYEFKELPAGKYLVSASKGAYVGVTFGQVRPTDLAKPIDLRDAETLERVDFVLPRGAVITGRVVDEYGEPMANIQVGAMRSAGAGVQGNAGPFRMASTNDLGEFRLFSLAPGQYYLQATWHSTGPPLPPGARAEDPTGYATTFFPGTLETKDAQRLTVRAGQMVENVTFAMVPVKTARISGSIVDSHGAPARGNLSVIRATPASGAVAGGFVTGAAIMPDGTFVVANLAPGDYTLYARDGGNATAESGSLKVSVAGADVSDVRIVLVAPSTVNGRIVVESGASQAVGNMALSVIARPVEPRPLFGGLSPARVAEDQTFSLKVAPGLITFALVPPPPGFTVRAVRAGGIDITDSGVELKANAELNGVEIELTDRVTTIAGAVSGARGEPTKEYSLIVFPQDPTRRKQGSRYLRVTRPDQDGRFKITGLPPAEYYVIAIDGVDSSQLSDAEFLESVQPQATMLTLAEAESKTLDLKLQSRPK